ncbi:hypothetical protein [Mariniradius sediminis]|uniref:Uncharacterized protein n=1 Tax=Mariniradius sediminis TaxID=2909237 RepID=A0ABS9BPU0_9BACT|nr:hypothetical protein [Mariniradius sediminis]MCF1749692.1 hypothetical protein [Mariniradius sediminis]
MKRLIFLALLVLGPKFGYSQNAELIANCEALIIKTFQYSDLNPAYQVESDSINQRFVNALMGRNRVNLNTDYNTEIEPILKAIYKNSRSEYDDSPDMRRYKSRRSICFATVALLSGFESADTFIEYSKSSLLGSVETPEIKLLENQYLGLLILELMLKIEGERLSGSDIEKLKQYLTTNRDFILPENLLDAQKVVESCKSIFRKS